MDVDRVSRLISARCGDAMTPAVIAAIEAALIGRDGPAAISDEVVALIGDVVDAIEARLDRLEDAAAG